MSSHKSGSTPTTAAGHRKNGERAKISEFLNSAPRVTAAFLGDADEIRQEITHFFLVFFFVFLALGWPRYEAKVES